MFYSSKAAFWQFARHNTKTLIAEIQWGDHLNMQQEKSVRMISDGQLGIGKGECVERIILFKNKLILSSIIKVKELVWY